MRLFAEDTPKREPAENGSAAFNDPAFTSNKSQPIHRWVPWIAGFSGDFVRDALSKYLHDKSVVLDPFAGVGTTLVEAALLGHQAVGFEINPYAAMACRVKASSSGVSADKLWGEIARFQTFYSERTCSSYVPLSTPPPRFRTRSVFYSPKVLRKVLIVLDFIDSVDDMSLKDLFRLAFASTMVRYSNYSYEPSLGRRASAGKEEVNDFPVDKAILAKLHTMHDDIIWFQHNLRNGPPRVEVINDNFFHHKRHVEPGSVDIVITSPPYLNNYHYNRNTRPHLYWLGFVEHPRDFRPLESSNFGKYWQTARQQQHIGLEFDLPDSDLSDRLQALRSTNRERGVYGGNGWANYAAAYFNDCLRFAQGLKQVLRRNGVALIVIGNSILQGIMIPTDQYLGQIAASVGLELVAIEVPRSTRVGNSIIRSDVRVEKAKKSHRLYEAVVEIRRP